MQAEFEVSYIRRACRFKHEALRGKKDLEKVHINRVSANFLTTKRGYDIVTNKLFRSGPVKWLPLDVPRSTKMWKEDFSAGRKM